MSPVCHGELALSAALLEELRQKLDQTLVQMTDLIREEEVSPGAKESLGRLKELSALQKKEHATGDMCKNSYGYIGSIFFFNETTPCCTVGCI